MPNIRVVKLRSRRGSQGASAVAGRRERMEKSTHVMAPGTLRGVEHALHEWRKNSARSARKKKDGAYKDSGANLAKSGAILVRHLSWVPRDGIRSALPGGKHVLRALIARSVLPIFK
jgi:hypothetical protein